MFPPEDRPLDGMSGVSGVSGGLDDPVAMILRGVEMLGREDRSGWSASSRSALVLGILAAREHLGAALLRSLGEWDRDRSWEADGARSAPSWLTGHAKVSKREAQQLVRTARVARRHERVGKALAAGDLAPAHVEVLARAARGRTALFERDVDVLVDAASTLCVDDATTAMKHWRSLADDEMARTDALLAFHERSVTWVTTLDGRVEFRVSLDAEGGATVVRALEAYDRPDPGTATDGESDADADADGPVDGPRTLAQRLADGLVQMSSESLARHETAGHHTPAVDGLIDVQRLAGDGWGVGAVRPTTVVDPATGEVVGTSIEGACTDALGGRPGELAEWLRDRCELSGIGPVARDVVVRMACDAAVGRIVMRGAAEVLDVGRRTRVVSRAMRRAIELRDGHCTFPGCDAPLRWCDVHHLVHWADGGTTDLDNCTLLCRRHHVLCHEGGWRLARGPDGRVVVAVRGSPVARRRRRGTPDRGGGGRYELAA